MQKFRVVVIWSGILLLALFALSVADSLSARPFNTCSWCRGQLIQTDVIRLNDRVLLIYDCECGQRGQKTVWSNGRVEWIEW